MQGLYSSQLQNIQLHPHPSQLQNAHTLADGSWVGDWLSSRGYYDPRVPRLDSCDNAAPVVRYRGSKYASIATEAKSF